MTAPAPDSPATPIPGTKPRLASLDALRGFNMFWLIGGELLVLRTASWISKDNATVARALSHAGFGEFPHAWDLVMPLFLFMSGVAMAFSGPWAPGGAKHDRARWLKIVRRVIILWILGMAIQGNLLSYRPERMVFFSNTLQAIAVGGLIAELVALLPGSRSRIAATLALPAAYFAITASSGGGYAHDTNVAIRIDDAVMGPGRGDRDYAWILPSLNFGFTTLIGAHAGRRLRGDSGVWQKTAGLAGAGVVALLLSALVAPVEPVNKHLWTGSFALWSGGWCLLLLAGFYGVVDGLGFRRWTFPLRVIGMNALVAYLLGEFLNLRPVAGVFTRGFKGLVSGELYAVIEAGGLVLLIWLILYGLYRKQAFLKF